MSVQDVEPGVVLIESKASPALPIIKSTTPLRVFELILVTATAFGGIMFSSALHVSTDIPVRNYSRVGMAHTILYELIAIGVLTYVVFRQARTWMNFSAPFEWMDLGRALALFAAAVLAYRFVYYFVQYCAVFATGSWLYPKSMRGFLAVGISLLSIFFVLLNPVFEEMIARAYFMTEVRELTSSQTIAVIFSTLLQTSYHLYQGWFRATCVGATFLVFSIYYARTRRIGPVIMAHFLLDALALLNHNIQK